MIKFINTVPAYYALDCKRVNTKVKYLNRDYGHLKCTHPRCSHSPALIHVNVRKRLYGYFIAMSCCRHFERDLTVILADEILIVNSELMPRLHIYRTAIAHLSLPAFCVHHVFRVSPRCFISPGIFLLISF